MLVPSNFYPSDNIRRTDGAVVFSPSFQKMQDNDAGNSIASLVKSRKTEK